MHEKDQEDPLGHCACLSEKLNFLKAFYLATAGVKNCFDSGEMEQLDRFIGEREKCMLSINRIDGALPKIRTGKTGGRLEKLKGEIRSILEDISTLDKACRLAAASRLDLIRQELSRTRQYRQGLKHRYHDTSPASRFLDMRL